MNKSSPDMVLRGFIPMSICLLIVGNAVAAGLPDQLVNIPSMLPMYQLAQLIETLRSLKILEQPSPLAESVKKCKKTNSVMK
jgi:hypothetical protein